MSTSKTSMQIKNGKIPLNTVYIGTPEALEMAKTLTPMGGVIWPASIMRTVTTPNQIGSKPRAVTIGKMVGKTRRIMGMTFNRQPRTRKKMMTQAKII